MSANACPDRAELLGFILGSLPEPVFARVAQHVSDCAQCETSLEELEQNDDQLLAKLRQLGEMSSTAVEALPPTMLAAARSARESPADDGWSSADAPRTLGKFELIEELGAGSFGCVWRAIDTELDRTVAIKILRAGRLASRDDIDRFLREARSAAQLKHVGIVTVHETGQTDDGTYYLVEEFVQGKTLAKSLGDEPRSFRAAAELVAVVADALDYAHRNGVIHRDIKPSNILIDRHGQPHLMDFGLAKREADDAPVTLEGQVLGTPAYMSPEQARGDSHEVDARSDIYSLGVILYELLTGERPFGGNRRMLLLQVLQDEPRPPRQLNERIPRDLETICLKAMAKAPARRYATARELAEDLRRYLGGEPIRARPVGAAERLWRWCQRNPVAASLLIAVSLGSAFGLWHLSRLSKQFVQATALTGAAQQAEILEELNKFYSGVADRAMNRGVEFTHDLAQHPNAIPLPATLTIELGKLVSARSRTGMEVRLYSDYPFKFRKDGGPRDDFERQALRRLRASPDEPVSRFEDYRGKPALRYATARRMEASCVRCHNSHPDSTKKDWKVGDVRGVVEIIRPLERDIRLTRDSLRGTVTLMALVSALLLGLSALVLLAGSRRRSRASGERLPPGGDVV